MRTTPVTKYLRWSAVALWAAVIFGMSSLPGSRVPGNFSVPAHFTEYAVLGALVLYALSAHLPLRTAMLVAVLLSSAYGVSDEFHQSFVPMRTPDPADWATDTVGALVGVALLGVWLRLRAKRRDQ